MTRPDRKHLLAAALLGLALGACGGTLYDPLEIPKVTTGGQVCTDVQHACGNTCPALTDADFCGASCSPCPASPANGLRTCEPIGAGGAYTCSHSCNPGYFAAGAGCQKPVAVASGWDHSCAIGDGGAVFCWGLNDHGQLGRSGAGGTAVVAVLQSGAVALAPGKGHTCALTDVGSVLCWGSNLSGQLGNGVVGAGGPTPVQATVSGATALAAGADHTCALVAGGAVRCWGSNARGQQGTGATGANVATPALVAGVTGAQQVSTFGDTTCALVTGVPTCWGANGSGQAGQTASAAPKAPAAVTLSAAATHLAVGELHACVHLTGGGLWCWGSDDSMQLGDGGVAGATATPIQAIQIDNRIRNDGLLGAGGRFTCSARAGVGEITFKCGGANDEFQSSLVAGATAASGDVTPGGSLVAVSLGRAHGCSVTDIGPAGTPQLSVRCWGSNASGQLGRATTGGGADGNPAAIGP